MAPQARTGCGDFPQPRFAEPSPRPSPGGRGSRSRLLAVFVALLLLALLSFAASAQGASDPSPPQFTSTAEETRFHKLVAELRCVMCQNQSLAESNAQIARDLRREVLELMRQGKSDREIKAFLVARYGEFVLYRPQVESKTWLLWFGPALILLAGGFVVARVVRGRGGKPAPDDDEQEW